MKKILLLVLTLVFAVVLTACGNAGGQEQSESSVVRDTEVAAADSRTEESGSEDTEGNTENSDKAQSGLESKTEQQKESADEPEETGSRILVTYFSRTDENYSAGYIEKGNTHIIADMIAEQTSSDIFEILTIAPSIIRSYGMSFLLLPFNILST